MKHRKDFNYYLMKNDIKKRSFYFPKLERINYLSLRLFKHKNFYVKKNIKNLKVNNLILDKNIIFGNERHNNIIKADGSIMKINICNKQILKNYKRFNIY